MKKLWSTITGFNIIIAIVVVNVLIQFLPAIQIDLTKDRLHSLSDVSIKTIRNLNDVVNVKVYETADLPPEIKPIASDLNIILKELESINKNKLRVSILDPAKDSGVAKEVTTYGIKTLQFSSVNSDKFEVQNGYFGMVLLYNGKQEVLPVISDVGNLEYFMISGIKKLTSKQLNSVALAEDGTTTSGSNIQYFRKYLSQTYDVTDVSLDGDEPIPDGVSSLIIAGRSTKIDDKGLVKITNWVKSGKGLITFLDRVDVGQNMQAKVNPMTGLEKIYGDYGMNIKDSLVLDTSATVANFSTQNGSFLVRYPYWPEVLPADINSGLPIMSGITSLNLAWASPIITSGKTQILFTSSSGSWLDDSPNDVSPLTKSGTASSDMKKYAMGAINTDGVKMALIGDADMFKDNFVVNNQQNLLLALNLVDYISADPSLMAIRTKILKESPITTVSDQTKALVKWANISLPVLLLLVGYGISVYVGKRKINQWYEKEKS
jgi:ABC-type uncharacterized transport system involved in gliding motility auxiliary subunit